MLAIAAGCGSPRQQLRIKHPSAPSAGSDEARAAGSKPAWHHFVEADALVFMGGSAAVATTAYLATEPSDTPSWFPPTEGGAEPKGVTIPNWHVAVGTGLVPVLIALSKSKSHWYHAKGAAESLLTTAALTELSKNLFQRHRPNYIPAAGADARKSFFSGHSSLTLAATTYAGLYLHQHVFSRWRGKRNVAWWEIPAYAALAAISAWVPYTRLEDNMHHSSDVITGGLVGASLSAAFFVAQELRFRRDNRLPDLIITPSVAASSGATVMVSFK